MGGGGGGEAWLGREREFKAASHGAEGKEEAGGGNGTVGGGRGGGRMGLMAVRGSVRTFKTTLHSADWVAVTSIRNTSIDALSSFLFFLLV